MKIILNLLNGLDPNLLVPIHNITPRALEAKEVLIKMFNSVPEGVFLDFLTRFVKYDVTLGNVSVVNGKLMCFNGKPLLGILKGVGYNSIIYMLYNKNIIEVYYIGSASNAINRLGQHQDSIRGLREANNVHRKLLSISHSSEVMRGSVYNLINYSKLAVLMLPNYKFSQGETIIKHATTEFIQRVLEQSLITEFGTVLNSNSFVLFTYTGFAYQFQYQLRSRPTDSIQQYYRW